MLCIVLRTNAFPLVFLIRILRHALSCIKSEAIFHVKRYYQVLAIIRTYLKNLAWADQRAKVYFIFHNGTVKVCRVICQVTTVLYETSKLNKVQ